MDKILIFDEYNSIFYLFISSKSMTIIYIK